MHRTRGEFVLRDEFKTERPRRLRQMAACFIAVGMCAGLGACAEDADYPSLAKIEDVGTVLTPEERQKALAELQKLDQAHSAGTVNSGSRQ